MVNIRNSSIFKNAHDKLNIRDGIFFDNKISNVVTPTFDIDKPVATFTKSLSLSTSSGSGSNIIVGATDKDYYITGIHVNYLKDAACDTATGVMGVNFTQNGSLTSLVAINLLTLTLQEGNVSLSFPAPVKVDRNTIVYITGHTFTAGNFRRSVMITGYYSETLGL